ncbi:hypothetical protein HAX54_014091, partial [Datura stramonium]|nr:hypothetical protein [Datura stramonium]
PLLNHQGLTTGKMTPDLGLNMMDFGLSSMQRPSAHEFFVTNEIYEHVKAEIPLMTRVKPRVRKGMRTVDHISP